MGVIRFRVLLIKLVIVCMLKSASAAAAANQPDLSIEPTIFSHVQTIYSSSESYKVNVPQGDISEVDVTVSGEVSGGRLWSEHNGDRSSYQGIMDHIFRPGMSERQQAVEAWRFVERETLAHGRVGDFFLYGGNPECQGTAEAVITIWDNLGRDYRHYKTGEPSMPTGGQHYTAELYWDGKFHIVDANQTAWFPTPWGYFAGFEDLVADCSLVGWQERGFYGFYTCRAPGPYPDFNYGAVTNRPGVNRSYSYYINLRPGESILRRWWTDKEPRWKDPNFKPATVSDYNGLYPEDGLTLSEFKAAPDFSAPPSNVKLTNIRVEGNGNSATLSPQNPGESAIIEIDLSNQFISRQNGFWTQWDGVEEGLDSWVSGIFSSSGSGQVRIYGWNHVTDSYSDLGTVNLMAERQEKVKTFSMWDSGREEINQEPRFRIVMTGDVQVSQLEFVARFQFNSRALPELRAATNNRVFLEAASVGDQGITVTHRWQANTLKFSENPIQQNKTLALTAVVKNQSSVDVSNVVVDFKVGEPNRSNYNMWNLLSIGQVTIPSIPAGQTREAVLSWDPMDDQWYLGRIGAHFVAAVVDPNNTIFETDETNNETGRVLNIVKAPNVMTLAKYISHGNGVLWTWVTYPATTLDSIEMEVENLEVEFRDGGTGGQVLGKRVIPVMTHGEAVLVWIPLMQRPTGNVTVIVDPQNEVLETSETDNTATGSVRNQAPPPFAVGSKVPLPPSKLSIIQ